jgi:hypothetical protein
VIAEESMETKTPTKSKVIPLISSGTAGPLGALHLPRLWSKLTLGSAGALADGYDFCGQGFDQMTIDGLGLDREATIAYVRDNKPTYMEFERYVVEVNGGNLSRERIEQHNAAIRAFNHPDEVAATMRNASGVKDNSIKDAVTLNSLEDLDELRKSASGG